MDKGLRIIVKGRVQGVAFRANVLKQAQSLGVTGFVRNLANGDVEIMVWGAATQVRQLLEWCGHGPKLARVDEVLTETLNQQNSYADFRVF